MPHPPQWAESVSVFVQLPEHSVSPLEHSQALSTQVVPPPHTAAQLPQFESSLEVSTHAPPQSVSEPAQLESHVPSEQTSPLAHAVPHAPQWLASLLVSVHAPAQSVSPVGQPQLPPRQSSSGRHAKSHAPQWASSLPTSTHPPPQSVSPDPQDPAHAPLEQTSPLAHAVPHAPQFIGSLSVTTQTSPQSVSPSPQVGVGPPSTSPPSMSPPPSKSPPSMPPSAGVSSLQPFRAMEAPITAIINQARRMLVLLRSPLGRRAGEAVPGDGPMDSPPQHAADHEQRRVHRDLERATGAGSPGSRSTVDRTKNRKREQPCAHRAATSALSNRSCVILARLRGRQRTKR